MLNSESGRIFLNIIFFSFTIIILAIINFESIAAYLYFYFFGAVVMFLLDRKEFKPFQYAYLTNGFLTVVFITIQTYVYPDSYGTTSPLGSWTDDSYFFALCSDSLPAGLYVRDNYFEYTHFFSSVIKFISIHKINHPLDVIFFQSIIAGILCVYSKQFANQITDDIKVGNIVFNLCLFSPFLLMHGGAILIRDTFVAAFFMLSLCFTNRRRFILVIITLAIQFFTRIGTAFILIFIYVLIFLPEIKSFLKGRKYLIFLVIIALLFFMVNFVSLIIYLELDSVFLQKGITLAGRETFEALEEGNNVNVIFLFIQKQNILIKSILSGAYIFLYPFLNFKGIFNSEGIDMRTFLLNFIYPLILIVINSWFFAAYLSRSKRFESLLLSLVLGFILIGLFSLQTRHKTILLPLYYIVVAIGFRYATNNSKIIGLGLSLIWFSFQVILAFR